VILCKAFRPPALSNISANVANNNPHPTVCHFGEIRAFLVAMLFITSIPESAEVTKKIMIMAITKKLTISVRGRYTKNQNIRASGLVVNWLNAPLAKLKTNHIAIYQNTDNQIKLNKVGMNKTAAIN